MADVPLAFVDFFDCNEKCHLLQATATTTSILSEHDVVETDEHCHSKQNSLPSSN